MKLKLNSPILDFDEKQIEWPVPPDGKTLYKITVADVLIESLKAPLEPDGKETGDERYWRFEIGRTIYKNKTGHIELKIEELTKLQDRVKDVFPSSVLYGNVREYIEAISKKPSSK